MFSFTQNGSPISGHYLLAKLACLIALNTHGFYKGIATIYIGWLIPLKV